MKRWFFGLCATLLLLGTSAHAGTYTGNAGTHFNDQGECTFQGPEDPSAYNEPGNWGAPCHPGSVPGAGGTANMAGFFPHATSITVGTLNTQGGGVSVTNLTADAINTTGGGGIAATGTVTVKNLTLDGGAIAAPEGTGTTTTLSITQSFQWKSGTISRGIATLGPNCVSTLSGAVQNDGSGSKVDGGTITNQGTLNWSGAALTGGGIFKNSGTFNMTADGDVISSPASGSTIDFRNTGNLIKTGGSGVSTFNDGPFVNNGGKLQANSGIFNTRGITMNGGTIGVGAGQVKIYAITSTGTVTVNGTLLLDESGFFGGTSTLTGPGVLEWKDGSFGSGAGTELITIAPGFHVHLAGGGLHNLGNCTNNGIITSDATAGVGGSTIINNGTIAVQSVGGFGIPNISADITNNGLINIKTDGNIGNLGVVTNNGTIKKSAGTGKTTANFYILTNKKDLDVETGHLQMIGSGSLRDGSHIFGPGVVEYDLGLNGPGEDATGTTTIDTTLQLGPNDGDTDGSAPSIAFVDGFKLGGAGKINWKSGSFNGEQGDNNTGSGMTFGSNLTVNLSGAGTKAFNIGVGGSGNTFTKEIANLGTFNWNGGGTLSGQGFTNAGTFNVNATSPFEGGKEFYNGDFKNLSAFNLFAGVNYYAGALKNAGGTLRFGAPDNGNGIGSLSITGGFVQTSGTLKLNIASATSYSTLSTNNQGATLGGTLAVKLLNGFQPTAGLKFVILPASAIQSNSKFALVTGNVLASGRILKPFYNPGDVTLQTAFTLSGRAYRFVTTNGVIAKQGIQNAQITLTDAENNTKTVTTDSLGAYSFVLVKGTYTVAAQKDGVVFDPPSQSVTFPTSGVPDVSPDAKANFVTYSIKAKVVNGDGVPVPGVPLELDGNGTGISTPTDANGVAVFDNLGAFSYTLSADQSGFSFTPANKTIVLPTSGIENVSPNGQATFTRTHDAAKTSSGHAQ